MSIKHIIILLLSIAILTDLGSQPEIDYQSKALRKALSKAGIEDISALDETGLSDSSGLYDPDMGKFFTIRDSKKNPSGYIYIGRVNCCRTGGCKIDPDGNPAVTSEYFDYLVLFDQKKTVKQIKIYNYQATHGQEVTSKGWLKQFIGYDGSKPLYMNKDIDAISGATVSVMAISVDVHRITQQLQGL